MSDKAIYHARLTEWIEALRSGKYKQGKYHLRNRDSYFCCLGVACDLNDPSAWREDYDELDGKKSYSYHSNHRNLSTDLDENLRDYYGIDYGFEGQLISANDRRSATFSEIADMIENYRDKHYG